MIQALKSLSPKLVLPAILLLALILRGWGLVQAQPVWHPDEFYLVSTALHFLGGDFNPAQMAVPFYPGFQYCVLAVVYSTYMLAGQLFGSGLSRDEFVLLHHFWDGDALLVLGRWTSVGFALLTVWWVALVGRQVYGERAGWLGALLVAVCVLHVRQSPLVAVDVPMTCWFVGAVWAALRLLRRDGYRDYALAGVLVGVAAATKYPGALVGVATMVAHWSAGRGVLDRRLWWSGLVAVAVFFLASPYVLFNLGEFSTRFDQEAAHLDQGRGDLGVSGWWYHGAVSLRYSLGWVGWGLALGGLALACGRPRRETSILLAATLLYFLVMGAGKLVFIRYALPLMVLQALWIAGLIAQVNRRLWSVLLMLAALAEPLYGSAQLARLSAVEDTRVEARRWLADSVPGDTRCCNFGGWGGDVPVTTYEDLWRRTRRYEQSFGRERLALDFLAARKPADPVYHFAVQEGNRAGERGDARIVGQAQCPIVILHRHPLDASTVDPDFAEQLARRGRLLARFAPRGLDRAAPRYDPIDAYYLPIGHFSGLDQPGPEIEIWRLDAYSTATIAGPRDTHGVFARIYQMWSYKLRVVGRLNEARDMITFARALDPDLTE